ncbi:MAG TPA: site-2 protease family protein [Solimonas sp.]|nr:site-2 protease family protein [Solimonas sp.]
MIKLLLLLLKGAKLGKLAVTGGSMLVSVLAYSLIFGWRYALGFVLLILVHEMGHYVAAKQRGLAVGPVTFIPFVGAWIELKEQPMNVETEAYVAMAGPLAGTIAAFACYEYAKLAHADLWMALAYAGFFLNLFNLIPLPPFDGGRITSILSRKLWLAGVPLFIAVFLWRPSPLLILVVILAAPHLLALWRGLAAPADPRYDEVPMMTRVNYGAVYLTLAAYLAVMSYETYERLGHHLAS